MTFVHRMWFVTRSSLRDFPGSCIMMSWRLVERGLRKQTGKTETHQTVNIIDLHSSDHLGEGTTRVSAKLDARFVLRSHWGFLQMWQAALQMVLQWEKEYQDLDPELFKKLHEKRLLQTVFRNCRKRMNKHVMMVFLFLLTKSRWSRRGSYWLAIIGPGKQTSNYLLDITDHNTGSAAWCQHCFSCFSSGQNLFCVIKLTRLYICSIYSSIHLPPVWREKFSFHFKLFSSFHTVFTLIMKTFSLFTFASSYEEGESMELPLKFEDIVDMYYDKMRPPKTHGSSIYLWN